MFCLGWSQKSFLEFRKVKNLVKICLQYRENIFENYVKFYMYYKDIFPYMNNISKGKFCGAFANFYFIFAKFTHKILDVLYSTVKIFCMKIKLTKFCLKELSSEY
jgi:hypothetical protein